jgi:hypothetical protein
MKAALREKDPISANQHLVKHRPRTNRVSKSP